MVYVSGTFTTCVTVKVTGVMLVANTVIVAVYVPAASPSFAFTVKVVDVVPLSSVVAAGCVTVKLLASAPLSAVAKLAKSPVPVRVTVTVFVSCVPVA
jgi:hypothetical protein